MFLQRLIASRLLDSVRAAESCVVECAESALLERYHHHCVAEQGFEVLLGMVDGECTAEEERIDEAEQEQDHARQQRNWQEAQKEYTMRDEAAVHTDVGR